MPFKKECEQISVSSYYYLCDLILLCVLTLLTTHVFSQRNCRSRRSGIRYEVEEEATDIRHSRRILAASPPGFRRSWSACACACASVCLCAPVCVCVCVSWKEEGVCLVSVCVSLSTLCLSRWIETPSDLHVQCLTLTHARTHTHTHNTHTHTTTHTRSLSHTSSSCIQMPLLSKRMSRAPPLRAVPPVLHPILIV
jgi:hypothetical protein